MTKREKELLALIKSNPFISQKEIAEQLQIKRSSVGVHITNLMKKGYIVGRGYVIEEEEYVVVIGASNIDISGSLQSYQMHDSNQGVIASSLGGVGRNIAENLGLLGVTTKLLSVVGADDAGERIVQETAASNVEMHHVKVVPLRTGTYLSVLEKDDMLIAVNDMSINDSVTIEHIKSWHGIIQGAKYVVLDTNFPKEILQYIAETYKDKHLVLDLVSNVKAKKVKDFIELFTTIKPNKTELEILSDVTIEDNLDIEEALDTLHKRGVNNIFLTLGKDGVCYSDGVKRNVLKGNNPKVVNVTGAGDAFVAGLIYAYLRNLTISDTATIAQNAAELAVQSEHTIHPEMSAKRIDIGERK